MVKVSNHFLTKNTMPDDLSNNGKGNTPSTASSPKAAEHGEDIRKPEGNVFISSTFLVDLISSVSRSLKEVIHRAQIYEKKYANNGLNECFLQIRSDLAKIEVLFENLLQYNKIVTPMRKKNTVHNLIETILKKYQPVFEKRETLIFRRFEKDLPEVIVPEEQLGYILNSVLQYILGSLPCGGGISFSTKSFLIQENEKERKPLLEQNTRWVEILLVFTRYGSSTEKAKSLIGIEERQTDQNPLDLILQLAKKMVDKNSGLMTFELAVERNKSSISIVLPAPKEGSDLL